MKDRVVEITVGNVPEVMISEYIAINHTGNTSIVKGGIFEAQMSKNIVTFTRDIFNNNANNFIGAMVFDNELQQIAQKNNLKVVRADGSEVLISEVVKVVDNALKDFLSPAPTPES